MSEAQAESEASRFYIESAALLQEHRPRTLKHGHTFAVFDPRGDIVASPGGSDGIYHRDTRYLSQLELRLNGAPFLLLSSDVREDNILLTVDLSNPDLSADGRNVLRGERIHVNRRKFIWQNCCYERLLVHNFDLVPHRLVLTIDFAADFADLFEVRGQKKKPARTVVVRAALGRLGGSAVCRLGWNKARHHPDL